ncbi:MAG: hypothetical protein AAFX04_03880 [Pseudomonadota bacterium]
MSPVVIGIIAAVVLALAFFTWKGPRLTGAIIWAFITTMAVCSAFVMIGPWGFADRVLIVALISPFIWVGLQFWLYWNPSKWRVLSVMIGISAISTAIILLSEPPV